MKSFILQLVIIFSLACALFADDTNTFSLSPEQVANVKNQLEAFEQGKVTLDEITVNRDEVWGRELLVYFITHSNAVTTKMKLPISRCFAGFGKYPEAAALAQEYVGVYSNDWLGWRIVGGANIDLSDFKTAVKAYTKAVSLGDIDGSCVPLAFCSMKIDRLDIVKNILPQLFGLKHSKTISHKKTLEVIGAIVLYSLRTDQEDIFSRALEDVKPSDILSRDDLKCLVQQGCEQFKSADIDKIRQELELATSSTNSVSSLPH